jgi:copper chaperone CopZ
MGTTVVLVILIIVVVAIAVKSSIGHFKGEGGCCGGGGSNIIPEEDKQLEGPVIEEKIIKIEGMHCENCVNKVKRAINKLDGASAQVDLKKNQAVVKFDKKVDEELLKNVIENLDFKVVDITTK